MDTILRSIEHICVDLPVSLTTLNYCQWEMTTIGPERNNSWVLFFEIWEWLGTVFPRLFPQALNISLLFGAIQINNSWALNIYPCLDYSPGYYLVWN